MDWKGFLGFDGGGGTAGSEPAEVGSKEFELLAQTAMSRFYGAELRPGSVGGVPKRFDLLSTDHRIVGDAKFYTLVGGERLPPAKFSTIAEYVWLLEKTRAERRFLVFGNDRRVPEEWLKRFGHLLDRVDFFFLDERGGLHSLAVGERPASGGANTGVAPQNDRPLGPMAISAGASAMAPSGSRGIEAPASRAGFEEVWRRVVAHEGAEFMTTTGLSFTYEVAGEALHPSRTKYSIGKGEVQKAFALVPFDGPGLINSTVRGPSYVWAILHDSRIRLRDW